MNREQLSDYLAFKFSVLDYWRLTSKWKQHVCDETAAFILEEIATEREALQERVNTLDDLVSLGWDLSTWVGCVSLDGGRNTQEWIDELVQKVEKFQDEVEAADHPAYKRCRDTKAARASGE